MLVKSLAFRLMKMIIYDATNQRKQRGIVAKGGRIISNQSTRSFKVVWKSLG